MKHTIGIGNIRAPVHGRIYHWTHLGIMLSALNVYWFCFSHRCRFIQIVSFSMKRLAGKFLFNLGYQMVAHSCSCVPASLSSHRTGMSAVSWGRDSCRHFRSDLFKVHQLHLIKHFSFSLLILFLISSVSVLTFIVSFLQITLDLLFFQLLKAEV